MSVKVAELLVEVRSIHEKALAGLTQVQKQMVNLEKANEQMAKSTVGAKRAQDELAAGMVKTRQATQAATQSTVGLQQATRNLTTNLLGTNVAAVALGTVIGGILGAALMQAAQAMIGFAGETGRLRNELATVPSLMTSVGESFEFVRQQAEISRRPIEEVNTQFVQLSRVASQAGVSQEQVNRIFADWNRTLAATQMPTLVNSFTRLGSATGGLLEALGHATGLTSILSNAAEGLQRLTGRFANLVGTVLPSTRTEMERLTRNLQISTQAIEDLNSGLTNTPALQNFAINLGIRQEHIERGRQEILRQINLLLSNDPIIRLQGILAMEALNRQTQNQRGLVGRLIVEQQILNEQFRITEQFRQMGVRLSTQELANVREQARVNLLVPQVDPFLQSLMTTAQSEELIYQNRLAMLTEFGTAQLITAQQFADAQQAIEYQKNFNIAQAQQRFFDMGFNAMVTTAGHAQALLQQLGQKSKAFAIAAIVVGKGMAIATTIQQGIAASMAALAPPPVGLGPVAGQPLAAAIRALTAVNVGLIAATGAAQIGGALSGGGGGGLSPPTSGGQVEDDGVMPTRVVIEPVDPAMIFTGEQLNNLIEKMNELGQNGTVIVATKLL